MPPRLRNSCHHQSDIVLLFSSAELQNRIDDCTNQVLCTALSVFLHDFDQAVLTKRIAVRPLGFDYTIAVEDLFRFSWKWRKRSPIKIMERTHEEATEALYAEEKVAILRRHLLEQVPISELCDKHGLQPTVFYRWQKEFFENGTAAFQPKGRPNHSAEQERIDYLEKKIQTKDEVLAELMAEHVALKKTLGEL